MSAVRSATPILQHYHHKIYCIAYAAYLLYRHYKVQLTFVHLNAKLICEI